MAHTYWFLKVLEAEKEVRDGKWANL